MALSSTRAIYNAAVDTLMAAMETLLEAEPAIGQLAFVPIEGMKGDAADSRFGTDSAGVSFKGGGSGSAALNRVYYVTFPSKTEEAPIPLMAGRHPMFWKITNSSGDL